MCRVRLHGDASDKRVHPQRDTVITRLFVVTERMAILSVSVLDGTLCLGKDGMIMKRENYKLTQEERKEWSKLKPLPNVAFAFWEKVALRRGLDYTTFLTDFEDPTVFSALPLGHKKHWCWPYALKCKTDPETVII
jgi:hypothetical protein